MMMKALAMAAVGLSLALPASVDAGGKGHGKRAEFHARLEGAQEVPPVLTDTSGRFKIEFNRDVTTAEFKLRVNDGTRVTQAHIHCGAEGTNGPVVVFLGGFHAPGWDIDGWWVGNVTVTDANVVNPACGATLADLLASMRAGLTYVNVHTVANPGGEVRGQIEPED